MTATGRPISYRQLVRLMPMQLVGGFDPLYHRRPEDLAFLAQHELDLHDEGEIRLTTIQRIAIKAYKAMCMQGR